MVIAGFEMDQVRRPKGCECPEGGACNENKTECAGTDIPVPLTCAYNHHFESGIAGGKSRYEKVQFTGEDDPRLIGLLEERAASGMGGHGLPSHEEHWMVIDDEEEKAAPGGFPTKTSLGAGNGGEYRKATTQRYLHHNLITRERTSDRLLVLTVLPRLRARLRSSHRLAAHLPAHADADRHV